MTERSQAFVLIAVVVACLSAIVAVYAQPYPQPSCGQEQQPVNGEPQP